MRPTRAGQLATILQQIGRRRRLWSDYPPHAAPVAPSPWPPPEGGRPNPAPSASRGEAMRRVEAILLLAREPLPSRKLSRYANLADATEARTLVRQLNETYDACGRAFRVEEVAGGFQLLTRAKFAPWLRRLEHVPQEVRLSAPALETLAVIAYRQPTPRAEIEAIRGVSCGEILRQLMERDLVRIQGRSQELGRPYLYGTTKRFLQVFGLKNLDRLPRAADMRHVAAERSNQSAHHRDVVQEDSPDMRMEEDSNVTIPSDSSVVEILEQQPLAGSPAPGPLQADAFDDDDAFEEEDDYDEEDDEDDFDDDEALDDDDDEDDFDDDDDDEEFDDDDEEFDEDEEEEDEDYEDEEWEEVDDDEDEEWDDDDDDDDWDDDEEDDEEEEDWE